MQNMKSNIDSWKNDQINYFKSYLKNFEKGSKEYNILMNGISELEKS